MEVNSYWAAGKDGHLDPGEGLSKTALRIYSSVLPPRKYPLEYVWELKLRNRLRY